MWSFAAGTAAREDWEQKQRNRGGLDLRRSEEDDNFDLDAKFDEAQRRSAAAAEVARQHEALEEEARLAEERTRLARERLKMAEDEAQRKAEEDAAKQQADRGAEANGKGKKKIDTQSFKSYHADEGGTTEEESPGVDSPTSASKRISPKERLAMAKAKAAEKAAARRKELEQQYG